MADHEGIEKAANHGEEDVDVGNLEVSELEDPDLEGVAGGTNNGCNFGCTVQD